jgi:organic hydroperoxide reductase OsmC/OhrA
LEPEVTIRKEEDRERTLRILQKTEAACLISNSIKSTITMLPTITVRG